MNIIDILIADHREVERLIAQILDTRAGPPRRELFRELHQKLGLHMSFEEDRFYPRAREATGMHDEIADGVKEHRQAHDLLIKLAQSDDLSADWEEHLFKLRDHLAHHISDEEDELFPAVRGKLATAEALRLAEDYQALRERQPAPSEIHP